MLSSIKGSHHEVSCKKTKANCLLSLSHKGYYHSQDETDDCHDSFAQQIQDVFSNDDSLFRMCVINGKLSIDLLIDFYIDKEFKHGIKETQEQISKRFSDKIFASLSKGLKKEFNEVSVAIVYLPSLEEGELAVRFGNNVFHGNEKEISIQITRVFDNARDSKPLLVGYAQQTVFVMDQFLLENDIENIDNVLGGQFIDFLNEVDESVEGSLPVPQLSLPKKEWRYQWNNNKVTFAFVNDAGNNQNLSFIVDYFPEVKSSAQSEEERLEQPMEQTLEAMSRPELGIEEELIEVVQKPSFEAISTFEPDDSFTENASDGLHQFGDNNSLAALDTFEPIQPSLKLILESIVTKGKYIDVYGVKEVETERLNGREQVPTHPSFNELGIDGLWQVNDNISFEFKDENVSVFGRVAPQLESISKYQAVNNNGERHPVALYGLSRSHLSMAKTSDTEVSISLVKPKKNPQGFIIDSSSHRALDSDSMLAEGEILLVGLFVFKLVNQL